MISIACFPLSHDMLTMLQYKELMVDYEIVAINSFKEDIFIKKLELKYPECKYHQIYMKFWKNPMDYYF